MTATEKSTTTTMLRCGATAGTSVAAVRTTFVSTLCFLSLVAPVPASPPASSCFAVSPPSSSLRLTERRRRGDALGTIGGRTTGPPATGVGGSPRRRSIAGPWRRLQPTFLAMARGNEEHDDGVSDSDPEEKEEEDDIG